MKHILFLFIMFSSNLIFTQNQELKYTLNHVSNSAFIEVDIEFTPVSTEIAYLIIPRSAPGTYELTDYSRFIEGVEALTIDEKTLTGVKGRGSLFFFREAVEIKSISYRVDIAKMESELKGGFASSKARENYLGILGYSVFGTVASTENQPIQLTINSEEEWPIFSTLDPLLRSKGTYTLNVQDYAALVDAQYLLGDDVQLFEVGGKITFSHV